MNYIIHQFGNFLGLLKNHFQHSLSISKKSLIEFKYLFFLTIFCDLISKLYYFNDFYTQKGIMPVSLNNFINQSDLFTFYNHINHPYLGQFVLILTIVCSILFVLDYFPLIAKILLYFLHTSLTRRNPSIEDVEIIFISATFIPIIFLDTRGNIFSKRNEERSSTYFLNIFTALLILTPVFFLLSNFYLNSGIFWENGSALKVSFLNKIWSTDIARELTYYPDFLKQLTFLTKLIAGYIPISFLVHALFFRDYKISKIYRTIFMGLLICLALLNLILYKTNFSYLFILIGFARLMSPIQITSNLDNSSIDLKNKKFIFKSTFSVLVLFLVLYNNILNFYPKLSNLFLNNTLKALGIEWGAHDFLWPQTNYNWLLIQYQNSKDDKILDYVSNQSRYDYTPSYFTSRRWRGINTRLFSNQDFIKHFSQQYICNHFKRTFNKKPYKYNIAQYNVDFSTMGIPSKAILKDHYLMPCAIDISEY